MEPSERSRESFAPCHPAHLLFCRILGYFCGWRPVREVRRCLTCYPPWVLDGIELAFFALECELVTEEVAAVKTHRTQDCLFISKIIPFDEKYWRARRNSQMSGHFIIRQSGANRVPDFSDSKVREVFDDVRKRGSRKVLFPDFGADS